jgi:hypothetical protein
MKPRFSLVLRALDLQALDGRRDDQFVGLADALADPGR